MAETFKQLDDTSLQDTDPNKRSLTMVGQRHNIVNQQIPTSNLIIPDITDIPDGITVNISTEFDTTDNDMIASNESESVSDGKKNISYNMIIDVLSEVFINQMREETVINQDTSDLIKNIKNVSFSSVIAKYRLDFKQSVAFEIMASSFLFKSLNVGNVSEDVLELCFEGNDEERVRHAKNIVRVEKVLGGEGWTQ